MKKIPFLMLAVVLSVASAQGDVVLENARLKLIVGDNAVVRPQKRSPVSEEPGNGI